MKLQLKTGVLAMLAAASVQGSALNAQEMTAAEGVDWYMGQFMSSMEQFQNGSRAGLSGMSSVIHRISREPRLTAEDRVMAESQMRCVITHAIDQTWPDEAPEGMSVFHNSYASVMALDVVTDRTIAAPVDLTYAWQAAECLWNRYGSLMEQAGNSSDPTRRTLQDRAAGSMVAAVSLYELGADNFARFNPDDFEGQMQSRLNANIRQFQAAATFREHPGLSFIASNRLNTAHAYSEAILTDLLDPSGQVNNAWLTVKQTQITGHLLFGEQARAAELAHELVIAVSASTVTDQRAAAISLARGLPAEVGVSNASTYHQTLDRLLGG